MGTLTSAAGREPLPAACPRPRWAVRPGTAGRPGQLGAPTSGLSCKNGVVTPRVTWGARSLAHSRSSAKFWGSVSLGKPNNTSLLRFSSSLLPPPSASLLLPNPPFPFPSTFNSGSAKPVLSPFPCSPRYPTSALCWRPEIGVRLR